VASIEVGSGPRFLTVGEGGVWVMNQSAGSVSRIDPASNSVVATIEVDGEAIFGGDVTVGEGFVWLRGSHELVAPIDPATNRVIARIGSPQASGGVHAGEEAALDHRAFRGARRVACDALPDHAHRRFNAQPAALIWRT
jgi:YVTN family beta-propeller protein